MKKIAILSVMLIVSFITSSYAGSQQDALKAAYFEAQLWSKSIEKFNFAKDHPAWEVVADSWTTRKYDRGGFRTWDEITTIKVTYFEGKIVPSNLVVNESPKHTTIPLVVCVIVGIFSTIYFVYFASIDHRRKRKLTTGEFVLMIISMIVTGISLNIFTRVTMSIDGYYTLGGFAIYGLLAIASWNFAKHIDPAIELTGEIEP